MSASGQVPELREFRSGAFQQLPGHTHTIDQRVVGEGRDGQILERKAGMLDTADLQRWFSAR